MTARLNPYLTFPGTAREAMGFYQSVLGGDLVVNTFGDFGREGEGADAVMHAQLETPDGLTLMASDNAPDQRESVVPGSQVTVSLSGEGEEFRSRWERLSEGATITMPMARQQWGDEFGMLTDRYGVPWMVSIGGFGDSPSVDG